jgi:hypothetical protein
MGMLDLMGFGRRRVSALLMRCFPDVCRMFQHPRPTVDPTVPSPTKDISCALLPLPNRESNGEH